MADINYTKLAFGSYLNYGLVGGMFFLMCLTGTFWGLFYLLLALEGALLLFSKTALMERYLNARYAQGNKENYLSMVDDICQKLDRFHESDIEEFNKTYNLIIEALDGSPDTEEKLAELRYKYARLLQEHQILSSSDGQSATTKKKRLEQALAECQGLYNKENTYKVKVGLMQNIGILQQRLAKLQNSGTRVKEIEVQIEVLKNSLELFYENCTSQSDIDTSNLVDSLIATIDVEDKDVEDMSINDLLKNKVVKSETVTVVNNRSNYSGR